MRWHHQHTDRLLEVILMDLPPPMEAGLTTPEKSHEFSSRYPQFSGPTKTPLAPVPRTPATRTRPRPRSLERSAPGHCPHRASEATARTRHTIGTLP